MNKIERQILENQRRMMDFLLNPHSSITKHDMICSINNTAKLLKPKEQDEECSDGLPKEFVNSGREE